MWPSRVSTALLASLLLTSLLLTSNDAHAQRPACVEISLPDSLPGRPAWRSLLLQETRPLIEGDTGACATVEIALEREGALPLLTVSWAGSVRSLPLALEELPEAERARAAALLARGLLQQAVDQHEREQLQDVSADAAPPPAATHDEQGTTSNAPTGSAAQLTPPQPPPAREKRRKSRWDDYDWRSPSDEMAQTLVARTDRFLEPDRMRRGSPWSGMASSGVSIGLTSGDTLLSLELGAQLLLASRHLRVGLAALGLFSPVLTATGAPGARASFEVRLADSPRTRVWLGPGLTAAHMIVNGEIPEGGASFRASGPVVSTDVRASLDLALSGYAYLSVALELAFALRYLDVVNGDQTLFAYAGPMLGLRVGVGF